MAWTARDDDDKKEFFDSPEELDRKVSLLAEMVTSSKHTIAFTVGGCRFSGILVDLMSFAGSWYQHGCWK